MKCLEKKRDRRYETANALARDVQRYLANEAVEAKPPSAGYQLSKFLSRNKGPVLAASAVLLAVLGGLTVVLMVQRQANAVLSAKNKELDDERAKVEARFDLAQKAIGAFHTGVSEDLLLKQPQFDKLRNQLLRAAAEFYGELQKLLEGQSDIRSRRALSAAYFQLGDLTDKIGEKQQAIAVHRKGLAVRRELASASGADVETKLDVARSLLRVGQLLNATGDPDGALAALDEQRDLAERLDREHSTNAVRAVMAQGYSAIGLTLKDAGKTDGVVGGIQVRPWPSRRNWLHDNPGMTDYQYNLALSHAEIGRFYWDAFGKYAGGDGGYGAGTRDPPIACRREPR